ncbi:unnamed protein product [Amoebophrya sp. A25]|nr:unnamed protein product [Amoebophrya sp. A25]|eukprot:GSA25T00014820001.1
MLDNKLAKNGALLLEVVQSMRRVVQQRALLVGILCN